MNSEKQLTRKRDLNERLIDFAAMILRVTDTVRRSMAGQYLAGQLNRSGLAPSLHYGEVQDAESANDFIHKVKGLLKELRESLNLMKIIKRARLSNDESLLDTAIRECNELISIFVKSVDTARKNKI